ncbi:hypothetical protein ACHAWF_003160, partial [Thalassiosira exigua]
NFFRRKDGALPTGKPSSRVVGVPNGQAIRGKEEALLPMSQLRDGAREGDILQGLAHNSLVGVPKLAANGYTTIFYPDGKGVEVYDEQDVVIEAKNAPKLRGWQDKSGLWRVPMVDGLVDEGVDWWTEGQKVEQVLPKEQVNNLFNLPSTEQRVAYIHACLGFPTKAAMLSAARAGRLLSIPFATVANINKFYPETKETPKGHLDQQRQGVRSTREANEEDSKAMELTRGKREQDVYTKVWDLRYRYLMVMVEIDSSYILAAPMKSKKATEMVDTYRSLLDRVKKAGLKPKKHVLDNEVSEALQQAIQEECRLELVPPGCHRRNVAEVAIKSFKAHFIAICAGLPLPSSFPIRLCHELLPQAELTLNLLRPSHARPNISALAYFQAPFDFNRTSLAPIGCEVQGNHWVKRTMARRVIDAVVFKHKYITWPSQTPSDLIVKAAHDLIKALRGKVNHEGQQQMEDLKRLGDVFQDIAQDKQCKDSPNAVREPRVRIPRPSNMCAPAPRVATSREESPTRLIVESAVPAAPAQATSRPVREVRALDAPPIESAGPIARNTRSRARQPASMINVARALCAAASMANGASGLSPQQAAARMLTLQMLCAMANAVLDKETGE